MKVLLVTVVVGLPPLVAAMWVLQSLGQPLSMEALVPVGGLFIILWWALLASIGTRVWR